MPIYFKTGEHSIVEDALILHIFRDSVSGDCKRDLISCFHMEKLPKYADEGQS